MHKVFFKIEGWLYDGASSKRYPISLNCSSDGVLSWDEPEARSYPIGLLSFSSRIGNTPRFIDFPDQYRFETSDNNAVDKLLNTCTQKGHVKPGLVDKWVHKIESSKRLIITSLGLVIITCWLSIQYGIPYFSKQLANALPVELATSIGSGTLDIMDESLMSPSQLPVARSQALQTIFQGLLPEDQDGIPLKLIFRKSEIVGANAFALPSGTIIFTDEMVELAENDDELKTIMLHEIGHVMHRHSLRHVIQQSGLALVVLLISGDVSGSSAIILAIPGLLLEASYSQAIEFEADTYALTNLTRHNISPKHFAAIMERLEKSHQRDTETGDQFDEESELSKVEFEESERSFKDYFSSHPPTQARLERFKSL